MLICERRETSTVDFHRNFNFHCEADEASKVYRWTLPHPLFLSLLLGGNVSEARNLIITSNNEEQQEETEEEEEVNRHFAKG